MRHSRKGGSSRLKGRPLILALVLVVIGTAVLASVAAARSEQDKVKVGLITKDVTNPFFVKMKQGATAEAARSRAEVRRRQEQLRQRKPDRGDREHDDRRVQGNPDHGRRCEG